jgi:amidase
MAEYISGLEMNPCNVRRFEDMMACTKLEEKEEYPSCHIAYWESVAGADDFSSAKIIAAAERMMYLGGPGGIDGALGAANADALIFPSLVGSDVVGLIGYPVMTVPLGFTSKDMPIKKNPRGYLIEEGPNIS